MKEIFWTAVLRSFSIERLWNSFAVLSSLALSKISGKTILFGVPFILTIEPTHLCNLKCPQCLTGLGKIERNESFIDVGLYKKVIDEVGDKIWYVLLYNQGEPFLHEQFINLIKLAKQKRIYVATSSNGHFLQDRRQVERLVHSGIDSVFISLDGTDSETYSQYRIAGNFDRVVAGVKLLQKVREELNRKTPKIIIQCLAMRHNEQQFPALKKLANSLGADRLLFKTVQIEDNASAAKFLPRTKKWRRYEIQSTGLALKNSPRGCDRLWYSSVVLCDGRVVPCCFDKNGTFSFGKLTDSTSFKQIWISHAYKQFRNKIATGRSDFKICRNCTQNQKTFL